MINFVSHLPRGLMSGGFSAANATHYEILSRRYPVHYVGPIDPPREFLARAASKALRVSGLKGSFFAYSQRRLTKISEQVGLCAATSATLDYYHGFTPWVMTSTSRPYVTWSDCTFRDYIDIYHDRDQFQPHDLNRIEAAEAAWLKRASRVLFSSEWAQSRAIKAYDLAPDRTVSVGIYGALDPPDEDKFGDAGAFAFVSTDFDAKGGPVVLNAFRILRATHPQATLTIAGAPPPAGDEPGISYAGFLRKDNPEQHRRLCEILATSTALVHPTKSDVSPHIVAEAAMFGCPAITSKAFALPEMVEHGVSGILLDAPGDARSVAEAMRFLLDHPGRHVAMRKAAWRRARDSLSKSAFEQRLLNCVDEVLTGLRAAA